MKMDPEKQLRMIYFDSVIDFWTEDIEKSIENFNKFKDIYREFAEVYNNLTEDERCEYRYLADQYRLVKHKMYSMFK